MKKLLLLLIPVIFILSCTSAPEKAEENVSVESSEQTSENTVEESDEVDQVSIASREEEVPKEEEWEPVEHQEPIDLEVINVGPTQDMDYPPFIEISLEPLPVNDEGHFESTLRLRINNTKFGQSPYYFVFDVDGSCYQREEQMSLKTSGISYSSINERRGSYSYDPYRYRLELSFIEYREPGEDWEEEELRVIDYFIITEEAILDIYFSEEGEVWQKNRTEIPGSEEEDELFYVQGLKVEDERFTFFRERRVGSRQKETPDYQSARQYEVKGRGQDENGLVFYLEDQLLLKNDYVYLYEVPGGIVYRERLGEK